MSKVELVKMFRVDDGAPGLNYSYFSNEVDAKKFKKNRTNMGHMTMTVVLKAEIDGEVFYSEFKEIGVDKYK